MITDKIKPLEPKNKRGAQKQAAYTLIQKDLMLEKRGNLMKNITNVKEKLQKLEETLTGYQKQLEKLDTFSDEYDALVENLTLLHSLVHSEILETKSQLLRSQISRLERMKVGMKPTGETEVF